MSMADRISTLPDDILCHILSFVPIKDAAATCLLSKQWKLLWQSVPTLYFDDRLYCESKESLSSFVTFVHAAILAKDSIKRLHLINSASGLLNSDFSTWVKIAVQRGVEHLVIEIIDRSRKTFPRCIFSCRTLVVLELNNVFVNALSDDVDLPSLKTLHLFFVAFVEIGSLILLLNGCPILEQLKTDHIHLCDVKSRGKFKSLPKLVRADVAMNPFFKIPLKAFSNVKFLRIAMLAPEIPVFHELIHLDLFGVHNYQWNSLFELLKHCPKLQIFYSCWEPFTSCKVWPKNPPQCISSELRECSLECVFYGGKERGELQFVRYIMQNAHALQTMRIKSSFVPMDLEDNLDKHQVVQALSLCPMASADCKLLFEWDR